MMKSGSAEAIMIAASHQAKHSKATLLITIRLAYIDLLPNDVGTNLINLIKDEKDHG